MRTLFLLLFAPALFTTAQAQEPEYQNIEPNWDSIYTADNFVPNLIAANVPWETILDSVTQKYPAKTFEISQLATTCQILKDPDADRKYPAAILAAMRGNASSAGYNAARDELRRAGDKAIPMLIGMLRVDAATRQCAHSNNAEDFTLCYAANDIAMGSLEEITGIYFYHDFVQWTRRYSTEPPEEKKRIAEIIEKWYTQTRTMTKPEAIVYFLDSLPPTGGSRFYTIEKLAEAGGQDAAVRMFTKIYLDGKMPCRLPMMVAQKLTELGVNIASEDCMNSILNYRCMTDNGRDCARYLIKNATSDIPFEVLAEVVATERFSRYRTRYRPQTMVWEVIFDEIATTKNIWAEPVLTELLNIKTPVKDGNIYCYYWRNLYPQQYGDNYRVCDFALLKLSELKKVEGIDWSTVEGRDKAIAKLLEN